MAVQTQPVTDQVVFQSRSHNLRLLRLKESMIPDPLGGDGTPVPGLRYEFTEHRLVVDDALVARDLEVIARREQLRGREFDGDAESVRAGALEWLRTHPDHGREFAEIPLSDMAPPPDDALKAITRMAASLDRDGLNDLIADERETFQREVVIETAEEALANVQPIIDAAEQQQPPTEPPPAA